jgi:hypothetical protein
MNNVGTKLGLIREGFLITEADNSEKNKTAISNTERAIELAQKSLSDEVARWGEESGQARATKSRLTVYKQHLQELKANQ